MIASAITRRKPNGGLPPLACYLPDIETGWGKGRQRHTALPVDTTE